MRYNAINRRLKAKFGAKVYKVTLHAGATCPNRDGTAGRGGCIYCSPESGMPEGMAEKGSIADQLKDGIAYIRKRHKAERFISYFQQYSNTYAPAGTLRRWYEEAIAHPDVVGLAISTRPDCLPDDVIGVLAEFNGRMFMWVELGLQSANDEMLRLLNRGHAVSDFCEACARLRSKDISVCAHVILGLPGETEKDIAATAKLLNDLRIEGVKIHNLHVIKGTRLEELYNDGVIRLPSIAEYAKKVVYLLERLRPEMLIHRFNSHAPRQYTVAPAWSVNKLATFNEVERELERQETRQGRLFGGL